MFSHLIREGEEGACEFKSPTGGDKGGSFSEEYGYVKTVYM